MSRNVILGRRKYCEEHDEVSQREAKKLQMLVTERLEDVREEFNEEMDNTVVVKTIKVESIPSASTVVKSKGAALLEKMGYGGGGLGKSGQGRTEPIPMSSQRGHTGLGHKSAGDFGIDLNAEWDDSVETKNIFEEVRWLSANSDVREEFMQSLNDDWIVIAKRKDHLDDEVNYCSAEILKKLIDAKNVFDHLSDRNLREARSRANPYETIGSVFFQNRAAMKMANMDRVFDWILTKEDSGKMLEKNPMNVAKTLRGIMTPKSGKNIDRKSPIFYFADVCAGPGGFTEYILWRKGYFNAKGFGFTLKGPDDFKLEKFTASSPAYFEPYYGPYDDGDVTKPDNIAAFAKLIKDGTLHGVDLMVADGGFSVQNQETIQEILSKRLYLCQFLVGLSIVRTSDEDDHKNNGVFLCKLFDIFTPFSIGLIHLMYIAFKRIAIHKPNTSRPANSERYIICEGLLKEHAGIIRDFMSSINHKFQNLSDAKNSSIDVNEIIPADIIDSKFRNFIVEHIEAFALRQISYLNKYRVFAKNIGKFDIDQRTIREECLSYWCIPDAPKKRHVMYEGVHDAAARLFKTVGDFEEIFRRPPLITDSVVTGINEHHMRYAELRFCALSEEDLPFILMSTRNGIFCRYPNTGSDFEKIDIPLELSADSVLYAQKTKVFEELTDDGPRNSRPALRIYDAAVLGGDDISELSYDERMIAVEKFCSVLNKVAAKRSTSIFAAKRYKLDEFKEVLSNFHIRKIGEKEICIIEDYPNSYFRCRAMRVNSVLAEPWIMCWSKSRRLLYAFHLGKRCGSVFLEHLSESKCCTSFYKSISTERSSVSGSENGVVKAPHQKWNYHWYWDWTHVTRGESKYGPRQILEDETHPTFSTWLSLSRIAEETRCRVTGQCT